MMTRFLDAVRKNDRDAFLSALEAEEPSAEWLNCSQNESTYSSWFSAIGATLLQITAFVRPDFAPLLIERGAELDLHSACALGEIDVVKSILRECPAGANRQLDSFYPIQFALRHPEVIETLLDHGVDPNVPISKVAWFDWEESSVERGLADWRLIHMLALGRGDIAAADVLQRGGAEMQAPSSPFGDAGIHLSAIYDRTDFIRWFVEKAGVAVDLPTVETGKDGSQLFEMKPFAPFQLTQGKTPLMLALGEGQSEAVNCLLQLGASVDAEDSAGFTPAHYAAGTFWNEKSDNLQLLLDYGADLHAANAQGVRPIDLAKAKGYDATVEFLTE
ncbi:MAG: hypothetical protein ACI9R3_005922 [Verrucomicrobiales bacterium]|jgi:hypothetical protein